MIDEAKAKLIGMLDRAFEPTAPQAAVRPPGRPVAEPPATKPPSTFKGVTQSGTLDAPELREPLTPEAQAELRPKIRPALPPNWLASEPSPRPEIVVAVCREVFKNKRLLSSEQLAALHVEDAEYMTLSATLDRHLSRPPGRRHFESREQAGEKVAKGEPLEGFDFWSAVDQEEEYREVLVTLKRAMRARELRAWAILEPVYPQAGAAVNKYTDVLEAQEQALAARFCVTYSPSATIRALRKVAQIFEHADFSGVGRPLNMMQGLPH